MRCVIGLVALVSLSVVTAVRAEEPKPPELTEEEKKLAEEAKQLNQEAGQLYQRGQPATAVEKLQQALEIHQKLYPAAKYPDGHRELATSLNSMGFVLQAIGQAEKAATFFQQSLDMRRKLFSAAAYPDGHPELATSLNNLGSVLNAMGYAERASTYYQQSLDMRRKLYPATKYLDGHPELATSLNNLGTVLRAMGQAEKAATYYQQSLDMRRKLYPASKYPDGHLDLAQSLNNLSGVLNAMGETEKAATFYQHSLDMRRKLYPAAKYPDGHPELAIGLNNLGFVLLSMGQAEKATIFYQQSLDMFRRLYPVAKYPAGHPDLANCFINLGFVLQSMGQAEKAAAFYQQSLDMFRNLYPAAKYPVGHRDLATSLNNLGFVLQSMGQAEKAATFYRQSLEMRRKLYSAAKYPDGHPDLAISLNNLGSALEAMGQMEQAVANYQQSLEMNRKLNPAAKYPAGHPDLARSLNNLGFAMWGMGQAEKAATFFQQSLAMQQRFLQRELFTASESAAFDRAASQPLTCDAYLSTTRTLNLPARDCYQVIAPSRSMVTRLLEQRLASARVAGTAIADQIDQLKGNRRRTDQLLQDTKMNKDVRDKLLVKYADERDTLERKVLAAMPRVKRGRELDQLGPADLAKALPAGAVFIDLIRYVHFKYVDKKQVRTPHYVAVVLVKAPVANASGSAVHRVELEDAKTIDDAVRTWRDAIDRGQDVRGVVRSDDPAERRDAVKAVADLQRLVWAKLAPHIPKGTTTLYLAPDGDLARMPWAALPVGNERVLLEDYAIAMVPHGTFLLEQLKFGKKIEGPESLLTLGGVDYGSAKLSPLPGTVTEVAAISALASGERYAASGAEATVAKLQELLPKARFAHLATHGEFNAADLTKERERAAKALESRLMGDDTRKVAAKNPLGYVGLVLSDGKVMSGLSIVDLKLDNLKLATLSACETGLGELTGGEGVQGLQRAFHLAGCPNVVASLWKVSDAATAALMAKFYHEMWVNKKPPIEALREAQLTIYRSDKDQIEMLAGLRGKPDQAKTVELKPDFDANAKREQTTPTRLWAAFVLSGVGR